jgi:hypothetical protein
MRGSTKVMLLAGLLSAAGACGQSDTPTDLPGAGASNVAAAPGDSEHGTQNDAPPPPADSTGRWGGGLGSGS